MVLTSSMCRIHGWGRTSGAGSSGSLVLNQSSSPALSFQTTSLLSLPCLATSSSQRFVSLSRGPEFGTSINLRDQPVWFPARDAQYGLAVRLPYCPGPHNGEIPCDNKSVCIASQEPFIAAYKGGSMHLGLVAPQNRLGLRRSSLGCHFVHLLLADNDWLGNIETKTVLVVEAAHSTADPMMLGQLLTWGSSPRHTGGTVGGLISRLGVSNGESQLSKPKMEGSESEGPLPGCLTGWLVQLVTMRRTMWGFGEAGGLHRSTLPRTA